MKNLIIAASVFFAIGATAQTKKPVQAQQTLKTEVVSPVKLSPEEAGKKDAANLAAFITVSPEMLVRLEHLFKTKHKMLANELTAERKQIVAQTIEKKLESSLPGPDFEKLKGNTKLYQTLIN